LLSGTENARISGIRVPEFLEPTISIRQPEAGLGKGQSSGARLVKALGRPVRIRAMRQCAQCSNAHTEPMQDSMSFGIEVRSNKVLFTTGS